VHHESKNALRPDATESSPHGRDESGAEYW
jgi:hypothetical protein